MIFPTFIFKFCKIISNLKLLFKCYLLFNDTQNKVILSLLLNIISYFRLNHNKSIINKICLATISIWSLFGHQYRSSQSQFKNFLLNLRQIFLIIIFVETLVSVLDRMFDHNVPHVFDSEMAPLIFFINLPFLLKLHPIFSF